MNFCFVTSVDLNTFWQEKLNQPADVLVFGFNGLGLVSYKKELEGETEYFQDVAKLSKQTGGVVISALDTDTYGAYRHSAVVADNGKILGVSDTAHTMDDSEFVSGGGYRVYDTSKGRIGIIVGEDLYFPEVSKVLSLCDSEVNVCLFKSVQNNITEVMLRSSAFVSGVPTALCADNLAEVADIKGEIVFSSRKSVVKTDIKTEKNYRLITLRRRGIYKKYGLDI